MSTEIDSTLLVIIVIILGIFGAIFGSFTACQVRRMRIRELQPKKSTPHHAKTTARSTSTRSPHSESTQPLSRRSICLHCHHQLAWYDNIPIISWLLLRGRCRYCHKQIGKMEILSEVGLSLVFILIGFSFITSIAPDITDAFAVTSAPSCDHTSTIYDCAVPDVIIYRAPDWVTPYEITLFILLLATTIALWTLLLYDAMWKRLPVKVLTFSIICAIIYRLVYLLPFFFTSGRPPSPTLSAQLLSLGGALIILPGVYFTLYKISRERWVGSGDWLLCLALAFLLGDWRLALFALFLANFLGSIIMFPILKLQKSPQKTTSHSISSATRSTSDISHSTTTSTSDIAHPTPSHQIAFGPFLIIAFILTFASQNWLLSLL